MKEIFKYLQECQVEGKYVSGSRFEFKIYDCDIKEMIKYKVRELAGGSTQTTLRLFGFICWACLRAKNSGWFRLFGIGITWTQNSITPMFSKRIGKYKKITIGNYRYGYLKPCLQRFACMRRAYY